MEISQFSLLGGTLLGLASALHCAGMCGGIASSLVMVFNPTGPGERARVLMLAQAGRISGYVVTGALVGLLGAGVYQAIDHVVAYQLLQLMGAAALIWVGLTLTGLVPMPAVIHRFIARASGGLNRALAPLQKTAAGPFVAGMTWGLLPCPMVYAALFTAMLTGSAAGGAIVMLGFGLGTLPAVTVTAYGVTSLASLERKGAARAAIGLAIAVFGASTIIPGSPTSAIFCAPPTEHHTTATGV